MTGAGLGPWLLERLFGGGPAAGFAARGVSFLGRGLREAIERGEQPVTRVRLQPGESYTVTAYPRPTRRIRRLTRAQNRLVGDYRNLTRPTRSQLRAARRLRTAQRRLARSRPGTGRHERLSRREAARGREFDRALRPSRRLVRTATELDRVSHELATLRAAQLSAARGGRPARRRVTIYD